MSEVTCPNCAAVLEVHVAPNEDQAGSTEATVFVVDSVVSTPNRAGSHASDAPATTTEAPSATAAAVAHADETGVDLSTVEGTGANGTITKPDVVAAAAASDEPVEEPPAS